jgi:two-component system nitrate/nitrite response regulator NarL
MPTPIPSRLPVRRLVRILIVDDMPQVRQDLCGLLEFFEEIVVIGEAINGLDAIRQVGILHPDVVVMDLEMPIMDGYQATRQIKEMDTPPKIIILSIHSGLEIERQVQQSGADALVQKGASVETLMTAILDSKQE